jgi:flagellar biosynthesis GTPase FlhF
MKIEFNYNNIQFVVDSAKHQILIDGKEATGKFAPIGAVVVDTDDEDPQICMVKTDYDNEPIEKIIVYGAPFAVNDPVVILNDYVIPANLLVRNDLEDDYEVYKAKLEEGVTTSLMIAQSAADQAVNSAQSAANAAQSAAAVANTVAVSVSAAKSAASSSAASADASENSAKAAASAAQSAAAVANTVTASVSAAQSAATNSENFANASAASAQSASDDANAVREIRSEIENYFGNELKELTINLIGDATVSAEYIAKEVGNVE